MIVSRLVEEHKGRKTVFRTVSAGADKGIADKTFISRNQTQQFADKTFISRNQTQQFADKKRAQPKHVHKYSARHISKAESR